MLYNNETNDLLKLIKDIGNNFEYKYNKLQKENNELKQKLFEINEEKKRLFNLLNNELYYK